MAFWIDGLHPAWITKTLRTITSRHRDLQKVSIHALYYSICVGDPVGRDIHGEWMDLDGLLVQFWESRGVRIKVLYVGTSLLPEVTRRVIEQVDYADLD